MVDVVRKIGQESLVDVENPSVFAVAGGEIDGAREDRSLFGDSLEIGDVAFAQHVVLDVVSALRRNRAPRGEVVCLRRESPARAMQIDLVSVDSLGLLRRILENRRRVGKFIGKRGGEQGNNKEDDVINHHRRNQKHKLYVFFLK